MRNARRRQGGKLGKLARRRSKGKQAIRQKEKLTPRIHVGHHRRQLQELGPLGAGTSLATWFGGIHAMRFDRIVMNFMSYQIIEYFSYLAICLGSVTGASSPAGTTVDPPLRAPAGNGLAHVTAQELSDPDHAGPTRRQVILHAEHDPWPGHRRISLRLGPGAGEPRGTELLDKP